MKTVTFEVMVEVEENTDITAIEILIYDTLDEAEISVLSVDEV